MNPQRKKKIKRILKAIKKRVKIWQILLLVVFLTANTFAWFIYARQVSNSIDVHVKAWNIVFNSDNEEVVNYLNFNISSLYPGMDDYKDQITITSSSETRASIEYIIMEADILGAKYISKEARADNNEEVLPTDKTSEEIEAMLETAYPFEIKFNLTSDELASGRDYAEYSVSAKWPFESGDDATDTLWGNRAYDYMTLNNTEECIKLKVKVIVNQKNG